MTAYGTVPELEEKPSDEGAEDTAPKTSDAKGKDPLEAAMNEAVASMEARENKNSGVEVEVESDAAAPGKGASEAITEALISAKQELQQVLEQTQKEAASIREKWLRAAADLENYKKRAARERQDVAKFGNERLIKDLLPVIDDLERAMDAISKTESASADQLLDGVRMVYKKFLGQLERHGATTFEAAGQAFDPVCHEAVQQVHAEQPPGTVVEQLQRGFMLSERLLRPAMVTVSIGPAPGAETAAPAESAGTNDTKADTSGGETPPTTNDD